MANEAKVVEAINLGGGASDLSLWGLFWQADIVVQLVMFMLLVASFWCWVIIFDKILRLRRLNMESTNFENQFWSGKSLETLHNKLKKGTSDPMARVFVAAMGEWARSETNNLTKNTKAALMQRLDKIMTLTIDQQMEKLERYMIFLATVGATAPFVGLFGTVWGIMNSFQAIALTQNTTLVAVAPGIAEALFATAIGLIAAIPAVIAYNKLSTDLSRYATRMEGFGSEFSSIISRQLDEKIEGSTKKAAA